jgi:hypothetical protein
MWMTLRNHLANSPPALLVVLSAATLCVAIVCGVAV